MYQFTYLRIYISKAYYIINIISTIGNGGGDIVQSQRKQGNRGSGGA